MIVMVTKLYSFQEWIIIHFSLGGEKSELVAGKTRIDIAKRVLHENDALATPCHFRSRIEIPGECALSLFLTPSFVRYKFSSEREYM